MRRIKLLVVLFCALVAFTAFGCTTNTPSSDAQPVPQVTINLAVFDSETEVAVGATKQLKVEVENGKSADVTYQVVSGPATVSATGLVTVNTNAEVGAKIEVKASLGEVESNVLQLTVVDAVATSISLIPSTNVISKGETVTFEVSFLPAHATATDYRLTIEGACDFATIDEQTNQLTINEDASLSAINGKQIIVKATLILNGDVYSYAFITVSEEAKISFISCEDVNLIANKDASKNIITEAYSWDGDSMEVSAGELVYSGYDEKVISVDAAGKITAKGHGSTTVTVSYGSDVTTECVVNVMVAPESINFNALNTHMSNAGELHFALGGVKGLDLGVSCMTKNGYIASTEKVVYRFENLDTLQTKDVAVVDGNAIFFSQTGKIRVTVMSDSSLEDYEVNEAYEIKKSIIVNVNDGMNIYTIDDLKEYAKDENAGKTANVMANLYVDDTHHFGNDYNKYYGLTIRGNRVVQGNGYELSAKNLSRGESVDTSKHSFLLFNALGNAPFSVGIYNLTLTGNVNIEGKHTDGTDIASGTSLVNNYYRALEIAGAELEQYDAGLKSAILESAVVENVTFKGFHTALRFEHAISAVANKVTIGDCFANGIENCQSHLLVKDVEIQRVGAFGIEVTPDDMRNKNTAKPSGTAGRQYNETATIRYEGFMKSNNLNDGASTVYMRNLAQGLGVSIGQIIQASTVGLIQSLTSDPAQQYALQQLAYQTVLSQTNEINFSTLIFIDPTTFTQYYNKGNTENVFCEFETTEKINVKTLFENYLANPSYDFTEKKFLILDLANLDLGLGAPVNLGQIVIINNSYAK